MVDGNSGEVQPVTAQESPTAAGQVLEIHISRRTIWQGIGAVLLTLVALWTIRAAGSLVGWLAISFFFSLALEPGVRRLTERYRWRRGSAVGVLYAGGFVFMVLMVVVLIPAISQVATTIGENGAKWISNISQFTEDNFGFALANANSATEIATDTNAAIGGWSEDVLGKVVNVAAGGIGLIFALVTIAMFTFYLTAAQPQLQKAVLGLFNTRMQKQVGWTWDQAIVQTGGYFYSRMILMVVNGLGFFFTMVAVGVDPILAIPLALFGAFVSVFIPVVGTYIGAAIPVLFTWATVPGFTGGIIVIVYAVVYQQIENFWLSPKITANTMTLNSGVSFGAALAGGAIAGPMGAFTALPVAALISSFVSNFARSHDVVYESELADSQSRSRRRKRDVDASTNEGGRRKRREDPTKDAD